MADSTEDPFFVKSVLVSNSSGLYLHANDEYIGIILNLGDTEFEIFVVILFKNFGQFYWKQDRII